MFALAHLAKYCSPAVLSAVDYETCPNRIPLIEDGVVRGIVSQNLWESSPPEGGEYATCSSMIGSGDYSCEDNFCPTCTSDNYGYAGQCDGQCGYCSAVDNEFPASTCMESLISASIMQRQRCPLSVDGSPQCGVVEFNPPCACREHVPGISNPCSQLVRSQSACNTPTDAFGIPFHFIRDFCQISCNECECQPPIQGALLSRTLEESTSNQ
eukprot:SAG31_NODE_338_length_17490_cov_7.707032_2_plen_212_part_00